MSSQKVFEAYSDEFTKLAISRPRGVLAPTIRGLKNFGRDQLIQFGEAGQRLMNPIRGSRLGWQLSSPAGIREAMRSSSTPSAVKKRFKEDIRSWRKDPGKAHLLKSKGQSVTGIRSGAEELSRRGWTGQGKYTKYLPVGDKGLMGLGVGMEVPSAIQASREGTDESGRSLRQILGGAATEAVTAPLLGGLGLLPGVVGGGLAYEAGSRLFK